MAAKLILITEIFPEPSRFEEAAGYWRRQSTPGASRQRAVYESAERESLLELLALDRLEDLAALGPLWAEQATALAPLLAADVRRQVLELVEAVKPADAPLPRTRHLQLRHVEVKPQVYGAYRAWRERTIYEVARRSPEIDVFLAYHSLISAEPGVMFLSGFTCRPEEYERVFRTPEYAEIVQQAGDTYITGGASGLYTQIYTRLDA